MPIYTVHEPPAKRKAHRRGPERFAFVRDGFYFWAFLFGPLWMIWRRLWLVLLGWIVISAALIAAMRFAGISEGVQFLVQALVALLVGLEAGTLRRWTLRRGKWRELATVSADTQEAAERRFFDSWIGDEGPTHLGLVTPPTGRQPPPMQAAGMQPAGRPPGRPSAMPRSGGPGVIGLFPEPGGGR